MEDGPEERADSRECAAAQTALAEPACLHSRGERGALAAVRNGFVRPRREIYGPNPSRGGLGIL